MSESDESENKEIVHYTGNYGGITQESKFWDDYEDMGEEELLKHKIIKLKIYTGKFQEKQVIFGISCTFQNLFTGEIKEPIEHRGSEEFVDVKEIEIKGEEYLTDFHIRFPNEAEYISQLGFETNKKNKILIGTEDGEDKTITSNGGDNIIIGTFGCVDKKLDAMGCLYITKKEFLKRTLLPFFALRHIVKKDNKFKENWEAKYKELPSEYQYLWKTVNLSDALFAQIAKFCYL